MAKIWRSKARIFLGFNLLFIAVIFVYGFKSDAFKEKIEINNLTYYNGQKVSFVGRVCEEADLNYKNRRLTVCASGQVLITTNLYPEYNYGDFIKISGELEAPPLISGFDYESYLARYDIYSVMYYPKIELASGSLTYPQQIYLKLINLKLRLKAIIDSSLPEPSAGLADALLLGYRRTLEREDLQIFSRVGLSHMIAISGSHITILSAMIMNFFLTLGLRRRRVLILIFIFLAVYPLITGLSASAVRSAIMGALAFLAVYYQRTSSLINALVFSAAVMLAFNPLLLRYDIGFQLSFLALLGIIYLYPLGESLTNRWLSERHLTIKLKNMLKTIFNIINLTLVSQIVILPIALINFGQLSIIAPLANVLVLWVFAPLLAVLIVGLMISVFIPSLLLPLIGPFIFLPAYLFLRYIFVLANLLAAPSWAAVNIAGFNWWWGGGYYVVLILIVYIFRKQTISKKLISFDYQKTAP